jgi:Zn-dependent peptidase ImmA (M78 family)
MSSLNIRDDQTTMDNFSRIFSFIKKNTDQILGEDKNACFSENPFVDIEAIAKEAGITDIQRVPAENEDIDHKHACLKGTIIFANTDDVLGEQRFSIAHEIFHKICTEKEAARSVTDPQLGIWKSQKGNDEDMNREIAQATSKEFGKVISRHIGKPVSDKTEKIVYEKTGKEVLEIMGKNIAKAMGKPISNKATLVVCNEIMKAINEIITETIGEEIADYFAANLLVPTERFILWEDKTDEEIARAFGVTEDCIRKRREEIGNELHFMAPKNLSSGIKIETKPPLSVNELRSILGRHSTHVAGRN